MRRREFVGLVGGAAAWPLVARAQQAAMPIIGYLHTASPDGSTTRLPALRQALKEAGYVEGENVTIEYRWADNQSDRLSSVAADLVRRRVTVIVTTGGPPAAFAAKAATATIPIVFMVGEDPAKLGLVASVARPGGNLTGINLFIGELAAKRLELLRELVPAATRVAVLVNPVNTFNTETTVKDVGAAARALDLQLRIVNASTIGEINAAFATVVRERLDALFVGNDAYFSDRRVQIAQLAAHRAIPAIYGVRENAEVGGLMSYGTSLADAFRQIGAYAGRILKGAKPADLPVVQASKFELVINHQTARMLGITVPPLLLTIADEVIE